MRARLIRGRFKKVSTLFQPPQASRHRRVRGQARGGTVGTGLEFGILGPLEVKAGGAPVRVGGPRQRGLLALLLCHANRVVSRDQLIDELLGDQQAESAERMLRVQISRLRKALASGGPPLGVPPPPRYPLRGGAGWPGPGWVGARG